MRQLGKIYPKMCGQRVSMFNKKNIIYIYIVFFGPVKPELGVIPSGQEIIHEWILKFSW